MCYNAKFDRKEMDRMRHLSVEYSDKLLNGIVCSPTHDHLIPMRGGYLCTTHFQTVK